MAAKTRRFLCVLGIAAFALPSLSPGQYIRRHIDRDPGGESVPIIRPDAADPGPPIGTERRASPARSDTPVPRTTPRAQPAPDPDEAVQEPPPDGGVEIVADRMEYDADANIMRGIGNVQIRQHNDFLRADYVEVHTETEVAVARGNVFFERDGRTWQGEQFTYNFRTRVGEFGEFNAFQDPYYISARESEQAGPGLFRLSGARLTTCSGDQRQEFVITAREATITDGSVLRARHVVARLYGIPIFYTPFLKKDFSRRSNIDVMPGYSSRMGAFLLTAYNFYPTDHIKASTQLDYRTARGVGVGQRVRWRIPHNNARGRFQAYYANDQRPIRSGSQRLVREGLVDSDRYWLGFQHAQMLDAQRTLMMDLNYVSDPFMLEDFFDSEFRARVTPDNRVTVTHRDERFTAALQLNIRLNDFFQNVNRIPEASLDVNRLELGDSGFYYDSRHRASYLQRVFPRQDEADDYDAIRLDTTHTISYPMRQFGFLSLIPSVNYRATWYSDSAPTVQSFTNTVVQTDETGLPVLDEEGQVLMEDIIFTESESGSATLRHIFTFGLDTSFKAFRVLTEEPNYLGRGLRHVAEPYAQYTLVPTPNKRPDDLYQFDMIDRLDKRHDIRLGMRNKLQTRRGETRVHDFIDLNTYTIYYIDQIGRAHV